MAATRESLLQRLGLSADELAPAAHRASDGGELPAPRHATLLLPEGPGPHPAVLYCHAHGGEYALGRREVTDGARWLVGAPAPDLLAAGFAVLAADMPGFGDRQAEGSESELAKAGLWRGRPLFGQMVADQIAAVDWLCNHPRIDARRVATCGTSMGGALAMWVAALDTRVAACVQLCMLADIGPLIEAGAHDRHGIYLTVPGLLTIAEAGDIAAMVAPRPQFIGHGEDDPLTPPAARDAALARVRAAYTRSGAGPDARSTALETFLAPGSGHTETPDMRAALIAFLSRHLVRSSTDTTHTSAAT